MREVSEMTYRVPEMSCGHCEHPVRAEVGAVAGVEVVAVDLLAKRVVVRGDALDDGAIRAAIATAGYAAA